MRRIAILIMAATLLVGAAHAQADPDLTALTPEAAVKLAVANNQSLARDRVDLAAAERALSRAWNDVLPGITLSGGANRSNEYSTSSFYGSLGASVRISPLVLNSVELARLSYEAKLASYETSVRDLELGVRKAFYQLILAKENIAVLRQSIETAQKSYDRAETKRKAGLVPELDALSARVNLENLKPNLESALLAYDSQLAAFKQLLGVDQSLEVAVSGSLEEAAEISTIDFSGVTGESPTVAALRKSLEIARAQQKAAKTTIFSPALTLSASYTPTYSSSSIASKWTDQGSLSALLSFSIDNLLPWSAARENADQANDSVVKLESQLNETITSMDISSKSLQKEIEQSLITLKARRLTVTLAERTYTLTEEAYRLGTRDLLSLQNAADSLQEARVNLMKEAYTLVSTLLDLEYALGVPFGTLGR